MKWLWNLLSFIKFFKDLRDKKEDEKPEPKPEPVPHDDKIDLSKVVWLHHNVSGWPVTANLSQVKVSGGKISFPYDKASLWPSVKMKRSDDKGYFNAVGNPWIFAKEHGVWYAGTWEWIAQGQTSKSAKAVAGDHIKRSPLAEPWVPTSGETYGFMVSGLARDATTNIQERSNIVWITWP